MPTDHPALEVDFYTWNRQFHGVRKHDAPDVRPEKLHPGVARVACVIAAHVNNGTRDAKLGHRRIAECAQVSSATVAKALPILEAAGWLIVERGQRQDLNTYRLTSPVAALRAEHSVDNSEAAPNLASVSEASLPHSVRQGASVSEAALRTSLRTRTTNEEVHSVRASADHADASANGGETELPDTWSPGKFHRSAAEKLHMDVETLADDFRATMVGEKRGDWDSTFGAYIKERSTDRADVTFPDPGTDEDPFAPVTTSTVVTLPDTTAAAIEWVTPALWEVGINPDTLTRDERADVVFGQDSGDPHGVARRIVDARTERHLTNVRKHIGGSLSAEERAFVATCVENGYDSPDDLATDIRHARKGRAIMRNAGDDPAGMDVGELARVYVACIEDENGDPRTGNPEDNYRARRFVAA